MRMLNDFFKQRKQNPMTIQFFLNIDDMGGMLLPPVRLLANTVIHRKSQRMGKNVFRTEELKYGIASLLSQRQHPPWMVLRKL